MSFITELLNAIARAGNLTNFINNWARFNFRPFWLLLQRIPVLNDVLNKYYISASLANFEHTIPRIPRYTLKHDYMTFNVLYDESRTTYSRLLPRDPKFNARMPPVDKVASLFERDGFTPESNRNLTVLIAYYAQWFSHMFLNTHPENIDEANQPLGINMSMLYGSNKEIEKSVRLREGGLLRYTLRFGDDNEDCTTMFPEVVDSDSHIFPGTRKFVIPIERANLVPGFAAIHIIFFRRHQYIAKQLAKHNRTWDDERLFQTTKLIMGLTLLRVTMHDYVARSLQSSHVKIKFDPTVKQSRMWRMFGPSNFPPCNAIQIEFNLLYRWHQFIPDTTKIVQKLPSFVTESKTGSSSSVISSKDEAEVYDIEKYQCDELNFPEDLNKWPGAEWNSVDRMFESDDALERILFSSATQRAGKLELMNTNKWLVKHAVAQSLHKSREYQLASYNDYREHMGFSRITKFEQMSSNPAMCRKLRDVYGHADNVEYYPGIFAEDKDFGGVHGPFLATIGVAMTFLAIHSSRVFESGVVSEESLTKRGLELFQEIEYLSDLTKRHTKLGDTRIRFTMPEDAKVPPAAKVFDVQSAASTRNHAHVE